MRFKDNVEKNKLRNGETLISHVKSVTAYMCVYEIIVLSLINGAVRIFDSAIKLERNKPTIKIICV